MSGCSHHCRLCWFLLPRLALLLLFFLLVSLFSLV